MLFPRFFFALFAVIGTCLSDNDGGCSNIITRSSWNAQPPRTVAYLILPLPYVVFHHTATPACSTVSTCSERIQNIQNYHMNEFHWDDVGFSFFIGGDGNIYEGVGWNKEGAHTYSWNKKSAGIAFIGDFQNTEPSQKMLDAARKLVNCGKSQGSLRDNVKILGARQLISTLSPGAKLYSKIQTWPEWGTL